ncbi:hypothetical protein L1785_17635 [Antribacter sp. KLBMP9083]|uniref:CARDB domain-containing protein n=1 Tax=Antribacter soli TaxID=2910976 RepID=A0AA41QIG5_9MICO|nr:CARDB domain-containing protein [Antribacter soli]MCF4122802.1 hypothetical protein [Antribacter soli]
MSTTVVGSLGGAIGGRFVPSRGEVVLVEFAGRVSAVDPATGVLSVLGSGYLQPEDVVATGDGSTLYVSERGGALLKADPSAADRANASVVVDGLGALHQLALVPDESAVLTVEHGPGGRLLRIDLGSGAVGVVASGLDHAVGLALDDTATVAYVTEQGSGGRLLAVDVASGAVSVLLTGLTAPFYLTLAGPSTLLVAERDPADRVSLVDVSAAVPVVVPVAATPFRPSCVVVPDPTVHEALVLCDTEVALVSTEAPGLVFDPLAGPLFVGGYQRVGYRLTGGLTPDDITFWLPDGEPAGAVSPSRDATWDPSAPHVMLLGGHTPGRYKLVATRTATGEDLATAELDLVAQWPDQQAGPPVAFVGASQPWVTGGAWGGGPVGPQNVNVIPASGTRRIAIVLVDTSDSRFPTTGTTTADHRARWANELLGTAADPDGVVRSVRRYFQEVSDGRFDVSLVGGAAAGPVQLPGGWTSYFTWNADRGSWWFNGDYIQAVVTAAQDVVDFDQVDTLVAVMGSLTAPVQAGTTLFAWPVASGGNVTYHRPGQTATVQRSIAALNMPVDWDVVDGRRIHETLSHEIGHNLGLPDLYMNVDGFDPGMQARDVTSWDLMSWDDPLPHLSVASKMMLGWVDPALVRTYNFATGGGGVDDTFDLQATGALQAPVPAGRSAAVEVRRADGWNYYFEYRRGQGTDVGDRQLPTDGAVFGTDVVSGAFVAPQSRRSTVRLLDDVDGDGSVLTTSMDYEELDPSGPASFSFDVLSTGGDSAQVRVRYGAGGRPDPSIRPWPGGDVWQSPDIEVHNDRNAADAAWRNVPWAGHTNRVVAKVANGGDFVATAVRVNFFVKDFTVGGAPETPIGSATHDIAPGATVEFETTWTPPANTPTDDAHYCVVVRIPLYQDPGNPAVVELTELNNIAQSNYTRFISASASPSSRGMTHVAVHNPHPERTRAWVVAQQDTDWYRTYLEHQWVWLDPGETRRVGVMYESLLGDPAFAATVGERRREVWKRPSRLGVVGLLENPLDDRLHAAEPTGGATVELASGRKTRIEPFGVAERTVRGRVTTADDGSPVTSGAVLVVLRPKGSAKGEVTIPAELDEKGWFTVRVNPERLAEAEQKVPARPALPTSEKVFSRLPEQLRILRERAVAVQQAATSWQLTAEYLGAFSLADSRSAPVWATF